MEQGWIYSFLRIKIFHDWKSSVWGTHMSPAVVFLGKFGGAALVEWLSSWLAEQRVLGFNLGLTTSISVIGYLLPWSPYMTERLLRWREILKTTQTNLVKFDNHYKVTTKSAYISYRLFELQTPNKVISLCCFANIHLKINKEYGTLKQFSTSNLHILSSTYNKYSNWQ